MRTLVQYSKSYEEDKSINSIHREQQREFCTNCGKQHPKHPRNKCPAYGTSCLKYECKANHWQSVCRSSKRKQISQETKPNFKKTIHPIDDTSHDDEVLTISTIEINTMEGVFNDTRYEALVTLEIFQYERNRKSTLQCKVDTGAKSNVLPVRLLRIIAPEKFDAGGNPKPEALEKKEAILSAVVSPSHVP